MQPLSTLVADVLAQLKLAGQLRPEDCQLLLRGKPLDLSTPLRFANVGRDKLELRTGATQRWCGCGCGFGVCGQIATAQAARPQGWLCQGQVQRVAEKGQQSTGRGHYWAIDMQAWEHEAAVVGSEHVDAHSGCRPRAGAGGAGGPAARTASCCCHRGICSPYSTRSRACSTHSSVISTAAGCTSRAHRSARASRRGCASPHCDAQHQRDCSLCGTGASRNCRTSRRAQQQRSSAIGGYCGCSVASSERAPLGCVVRPPRLGVHAAG